VMVGGGGVVDKIGCISMRLCRRADCQG